jgi:hypothetical protein
VQFHVRRLKLSHGRRELVLEGGQPAGGAAGLFRHPHGWHEWDKKKFYQGSHFVMDVF